MPDTTHLLRLTLASATLLGLTACAHTIAGTTVRDTTDNRAVYDVLEALRNALQARDVDGTLKLVSTRYFEDMGTPDPKDDYGYDQLKADILPKSLAVTKEMYVTFEVHDIIVDGDAAHADLRYNSRARIDLPSGTLWDSHKEFNRVELAKEGTGWRITSGL